MSHRKRVRAWWNRKLAAERKLVRAWWNRKLAAERKLATTGELNAYFKAKYRNNTLLPGFSALRLPFLRKR